MHAPVWVRGTMEWFTSLFSDAAPVTPAGVASGLRVAVEDAVAQYAENIVETQSDLPLAGLAGGGGPVSQSRDRDSKIDPWVTATPIVSGIAVINNSCWSSCSWWIAKDPTWISLSHCL